MSGDQIFELYRPTSVRNRLFSRNIRHYVGNTGTNKGIEQSALSEPENFFFYNNGISAIATNIEEDLEEHTLKCWRFSVVNGAQTVRSLYRVGLAPNVAEALRRIHVLVRVTEAENKITKAEEEFLERVTRYNNTQNEIKISDFRSNDRVQAELREYFSRLTYSGKAVMYKNKRGWAEKESNRHIVSMEEFTKTVFAFQFGPDDMYGGTKFLFDPGTDGGYRMLFGDAGVDAELNQETFDCMAGIWFLCSQVRNDWAVEKLRFKDDPDTKAAVERRWMVYYAVGEALRIQYARSGRELNNDLRHLGKPSWLDRDGQERTSIRTLAGIACEALIDAYADAKRSPTFSHRNWFRSKQTVVDLKRALDRLLGMMSRFGQTVLLRSK